MALSLITVLSDEAGQVQVIWTDLQADLLARFAAGAGVGGFARFGLQLATARAPESPIRHLRPFEQQHLVALVEAIEQRGDFMGQGHAGSETDEFPAGKRKR